MNDTININASSSSSSSQQQQQQQTQQRQQLQSQQQQQQHSEDSEELLVTSTSSSTTPPNNLTTNAIYPTSVIASSSTSPNSSSSSPFSNTNTPVGISTGASPTSSSAIVPVSRPFNQPSETESSGGESGGENSPPLTANSTAGASIAISPSTSSAGFCQIVSSSTENISPSKTTSLVNYDIDSEDEFDEDDEYLEEIEQQQHRQQQSKMVNSTNTVSDSGELCVLPSSSSSSSYDKSKENPNISPPNMNTPRLSGLTTRSTRRKLEIESMGSPNSSHLGSRNLNILKNQVQPPSIIIKKTSSNTPSNQQNIGSLIASSSSSTIATATSSPSTSFTSTSYSSSSINLMKSDNLLNSSSNRLGISNDNEQSQQIDSRLINNNNNNNNNSNNNNSNNNINNNNNNNISNNSSNGSTSCLSGVTNCISNSNNNNTSGQNSSTSSNSSSIITPAKISIKIANKYNFINSNLESQQNSTTKSKINSNEFNSSSNINYTSNLTQSTLSSSHSTLNCNNSNDSTNVEQRKVEPLKINLNRHDSPIPKITIKPIVKPSADDESNSTELSCNLSANNTSSSILNCSSNNVPIPKLTIKQSSSSTEANCSNVVIPNALSTTSTTSTILSEPHIVPKLTIKTSSSDISGNPVQSVIVPKLTIKMDNTGGIAGTGNVSNINRIEQGSSSSRSSSTSPSCSSRSSPSPTQERHNIVKGEVNKKTCEEMPPLPKLTIKTTGDCVETIIAKVPIQENQEQQQQKPHEEQQQPQQSQHLQECHIVANTLSPTSVPKLTIKTYTKPSSSSSTIISSCSTPTLNAILSQSDGSIVPKLTIKPILQPNIEENIEVIPKITIKANPASGHHSTDSTTTVYSSELHSKKSLSGNSTSSSSKEPQSIPKLTIRAKSVSTTASLESTVVDENIEDKTPKFSIKHTSHLDNSQTIPKLTIHVNESSSGLYTSAAPHESSSSNSMSNVTSNERVVPKIKINLQEKTTSRVDGQDHVILEEGNGSINKALPKKILKSSQLESNNIPKHGSENDKTIPKLTIISSGNQASVIAENTTSAISDSVNISEKIPKLVIKQSTSETAGIIGNQISDEVDKSTSKLIIKDIQFCENENVPQLNDRSIPKVMLRDIRIERNKKDLAKSKNSSGSPLSEKKLKTQTKIKLSSNKRLSPTLEFLNTDCSTSQDNSNICIRNNCQPSLENDCILIGNKNELKSTDVSIKNVENNIMSSNRLQDCVQNNLDAVPIKIDDGNQILNRQSQELSNKPHQELLETVDLTDTPSPGSSPNPQHNNLNQDNYNTSKRLNNQLLYDILKGTKHDGNIEKCRGNNYGHILNGQHAVESERNKLDDILMQNEMTNDSNSFIVNHFQGNQNCIDGDVVLQNDSIQNAKESNRCPSSSMKRKPDGMFSESGNNGDCTNEIPYKRTKDNLIGANQIIETSTTSLSSFEVCLKMTPTNCLTSMNNITDTISLPDSESDNIMLCDTGANSLDGTKFCTVTDFESIESIDEDDEVVEIVSQEGKPSGEEKPQLGQQNLQNTLQDNKLNNNKIKDIVDLTDEICSTKESVILNSKNKNLLEEQNIIAEIHLPLNSQNMFESEQANSLSASDAMLSENALGECNQIQNLVCAENSVQDRLNILLQHHNDQDSNSNEVPEINMLTVPPSYSTRRGRGRPKKPMIKENSIKPKRRTQVSMMLEDALHSQVYKDRSPTIVENQVCIEENNETNMIISNDDQFNAIVNEVINEEISIDNPHTPEKSCSQDEVYQTPHIFATPLDFGSPKSPSNLFSESFDSQDGNEEFSTPTRRGRGRGRGNRGSARGGRGRGGRGRGSRGGRGRPFITPRRPIGGLTHTPNPNLIRERNFSQEGKPKNIFDQSTIQVFEEDTRMSADSSNIPRQSEFLNDENSQSSVLSSTSILDQSISSVKKRSKLEVLDPDGKTEYPVERIAEYDWPPPKGCCPDRNRETYMIQEQIAEYLGIKSFKRKYPDLFRRQIDMEERNYLRDKALVTEKMCDLGITAVLAYEVLDIMYLDFYDKYEEYKNYLRQKHLKEIEAKQKGLSHNNVDKSLQIRDRALQSASKWNTHFNNERKEERRMCIDLQTYVINKPLPKTAAGTVACMGKVYRPIENLVPKKPITPYPIALVPGQFGETYKAYTPADLRKLPLNTVIESPILANFQIKNIKTEKPDFETKLETKVENNSFNDVGEELKDIKDVQLIKTNENNSDDSSDSSESESSDSETYSDSDDSEEDLPPDGIKCSVCHLPQNRNLKGKPEVCIECYTCRRKVHPSCIEMSTNVLNRVLSYNWQCAECKCCIKCKRNADRTKMLFCEQCDRAYHIYCIQIKTLPDKRWSCERCAICRRCGATDPLGNPSSQLLSPNPQVVVKKNQRRSTKWVNEYRTDHLTRLREHSNMLCIPCSKMKLNSTTTFLDNINIIGTSTQSNIVRQTTIQSTGNTVILSPQLMSPPIVPGSTFVKTASNNPNTISVTNSTNVSSTTTTTSMSNS
ncbi:putative mediator of RNA polymerase II transcription subunit 26 isoform X2 [Condylostylus longicornis]|uniref:putative mediator of RNA polymerase II transcription subunit 26 isoform X2 n=1 Tax=Condylostylus longicornis TaxID=2530218 RepID=UPI00244E4697|nr:putative mediator of RNA polymerase II transcription subunit 26 isoform X2 [Condylostylus longicornis]